MSVKPCHFLNFYITIYNNAVITIYNLNLFNILKDKTFFYSMILNTHLLYTYLVTFIINPDFNCNISQINKLFTETLKVILI